MKTRRQILKEQLRVRYTSIYRDVQGGMSFKGIAKKYGYKTAASASTTYYMAVLPMITIANNL